MDASTSQLAWQRSTRCASGSCVEVAKIDTTYVMRDSKDPDGPILAFTKAEWDAFVSGVLAGDFVFD